MRERRYIAEEQTDCPKCGYRLSHQGSGQSSDVEWRRCHRCETSYAVAPPALDREVVESRYLRFLTELAEHAEQVRDGEADADRLRQWCERCAEEWALPLQPAAVDAIVVAATGKRDDTQRGGKPPQSEKDTEKEGTGDE